MKTALIAALFAGVFTVSAFAAENNTNLQSGNQSGPGGRGGGQMTVAQKKVEILARIDERIANNQAERTCIQSAATHDELRACREKHRPQQRSGQQGGGQQSRRGPQQSVQ
jgi:hypothetical protein